MPLAIVVGDLVPEDLGQPGALARAPGVSIPELERGEERLLDNLLRQFPPPQPDEGEAEKGIPVQIDPLLRIGRLMFRCWIRVISHGGR